MHRQLPMRPTRRRLLRAPLTLLLSAAVTACAATVTTQVTPFHELAGSLQGQRFVILPTPEQQSSLEFGAYADLVREALTGKGLVDAGNDRAGADLGVSMNYEVIGRAPGSRSGTGGYAGVGAGTGGFSMGGVGFGIGFPIGGGGSDADYQRTLLIRIDRLRPGAAPASAPTAAAARIFEARAISAGPSASIAPVMRAMVQAIFQEFPGESGKTRVVRVPLENTR